MQGKKSYLLCLFVGHITSWLYQYGYIITIIILILHYYCKIIIPIFMPDIISLFFIFYFFWMTWIVANSTRNMYYKTGSILISCWFNKQPLSKILDQLDVTVSGATQFNKNWKPSDPRWQTVVMVVTASDKTSDDH